MGHGSPWVFMSLRLWYATPCPCGLSIAPSKSGALTAPLADSPPKRSTSSCVGTLKKMKSLYKNYADTIGWVAAIFTKSTRRWRNVTSPPLVLALLRRPASLSPKHRKPWPETCDMDFKQEGQEIFTPSETEKKTTIYYHLLLCLFSRGQNTWQIQKNAGKPVHPVHELANWW